MSYNSVDQSIESGSVIELYEFTQGSQRFTYCSSESSVTYMSQVYKPFAGSRKGIKQTSDVLKDSITFTFPRGDEFAKQYLGFAPDNVVTVTIYRGHSTDVSSEFVVYWKGRVIGTKTSGNEISIDCESVFTSIKRPGLRARFEYNCRHVLYSANCGINREAYRVDGAVTGLNGTIITVQGANLNGDGFYNGGIIQLRSGASRFITSQVGDVITVSRPFSELTGGMVVAIYPGCDHLMSTCQSKFDNIDNFGGFPWIPSKNPFGGSSIV